MVCETCWIFRGAQSLHHSCECCRASPRSQFDAPWDIMACDSYRMSSSGHGDMRRSPSLELKTSADVNMEDWAETAQFPLSSAGGSGDCYPADIHDSNSYFASGHGDDPRPMRDAMRDAFPALPADAMDAMDATPFHELEENSPLGHHSYMANYTSPFDEQAKEVGFQYQGRVISLTPPPYDADAAPHCSSAPHMPALGPLAKLEPSDHGEYGARRTDHARPRHMSQPPFEHKERLGDDVKCGSTSQDAEGASEHSDRQTEEYRNTGLRELEHAVTRVFGEWQYPHLLMRARDIFRKAVEIQAEQKEGLSKFTHRRASDNGDHRLRFGRRKAFVIASIVIAMKEFGLSIPGSKKRKDRDAVEVLSQNVPGKQRVSLDSVKSCCNTLGIQIRLS